MPRDIPIGNGSLLVNFDCSYQLRDLYWPHVGQENHTAGHPFHFGVFVDGKFSWVDGEGWERRQDYVTDTMVTKVTLTNPELELSIECNDTVDFHENLYLRKITLHNQAGRAREVRLFFSQDFHISGHAVGDSAYYEPERLAVFHYKGKRWFMINCAKESPAGEWELGVDQWAVGIKEGQGHEGTWRDAEDGELSGNAVAQGSVDSAVALHLSVPAGGTAVGWYWIAVGENFEAVTKLNRMLRQRGPASFLKRTHYYWALWVEKERENLSELPEPIRHLYRRSLLILRSQIDNGGAILAANDFDVARFYSDTYSYMWPRDGALVAAALIETNYSEVTRRFFNFCHHVITEEGYLLHKYNPDGSLASSWHGWYLEGRKELPIQEDETALVIWALWRHFLRFRDIEFIKPLFRGLIVRAANWMVSYRDEETGLPQPSWDLWEERRGVLGWTVGAVWGGLQAAANFAEVFGETELADSYRRVAGEIKQGTEKYLWQPEAGCYARMLDRRPDGTFEIDGTAESSLIGLWYFGMMAPSEPRIVATMERIRERLWVKTGVGGCARYENDQYHRAVEAANVPGNPWFICTLWLAQWQIAVAREAEELAVARELLEWAAEHALTSGVMAEQVHPESGTPLSVSPLTWSHATFVLAVREYLCRLSEGVCLPAGSLNERASQAH